MAEPFINDEDSDRPVCGVCPSLRFPRDGFTVADRPSRVWPFNPADGYRYLQDGTPVCVHPDKVGLPPEHFAPPPEPVRNEPEPTPRKRRWFAGRRR